MKSTNSLYPVMDPWQNRDEQRKKGFAIVLGDHCSDDFISKIYRELPGKTFENGQWYVKTGVYEPDNAVTYVEESIAKYYLPGYPASSIRIYLDKFLADQYFGSTWAGFDIYLTEFSNFIGIQIDMNNIREHLNSFRAFLHKETRVDIDRLRRVVDFIITVRK